MVRFEDVSLRYERGPEIFGGLTFDLKAGSFHYLFGPSGSGKSSLLRLLYLAQRPTTGRVSLFGQDVSNLTRNQRSDLRREMGVVFQDFRLLGHLTVMENVALPLRVAGQKSQKILEHAKELLDWVGLAEHLEALPPTLSGGQQQRVAIARAVISKPNILLADEPTGNVDDPIGYRLLRLFDELHKMGTTVVVATHNERLISHFDHPRLRLEAGAMMVDTSTPRKPAPLHGSAA